MPSPAVGPVRPVETQVECGGGDTGGVAHDLAEGHFLGAVHEGHYDGAPSGEGRRL